MWALGPILEPVPDTNAANHPAELRLQSARSEWLAAGWGAGPSGSSGSSSSASPAAFASAVGGSIRSPGPAHLSALQEAAGRACAAAAVALSQADILLVATGAGLSADSGLPVYKDVADVPPYQSRGLLYHDLCQPHWLDSEPDLFFGFWGKSFNDYRDRRPHEGYSILLRWLARRPALRFFSLTSNVDDHFVAVRSRIAR